MSWWPWSRPRPAPPPPIPVPPPPRPVFPGRLTVMGSMFRDVRRVRWIWKGCSDFRLFQWYLDGQDILPILRERRDLGFNVLRVFCMYEGGIGEFWPQRYPHYDAQMQEFIQLVGQYGLRIEWNVLACCDVMLPKIEDQRWFVDQVVNRCRGWTNCFVSLGNEAPKNGWKPEHFSKPTGPDAPLFSFGSSLSDTPPERRDGDYLEWHGRRDWPKVFVSAEDMWYVGYGVSSSGEQYDIPRPMIHDEPIGFAEVEEPGHRSTNPDLARTIALSGIAYGSGATFHSTDGIQSHLFRPTTLQCARAFCDALRSA